MVREGAIIVICTVYKNKGSISESGYYRDFKMTKYLLKMYSVRVPERKKQSGCDFCFKKADRGME